MTPLKTAVIGMGRMGITRVDAMARHGGFEVIGVCDNRKEAIENSPFPAYTDWMQCIDETKPEAVMVCTVNNHIVEVVCECLARGMHVFSEKPPGRNLDDAKKMEKAYLAANGPILKFGFNHRYHNSVIEAKALVDSGLIGGIVCARGVYGKAGSPTFAREWRNDPQISGGGILIDQGIHMLDLLRYFLGDFTEIDSSVDRLSWNDIPTEDSAFAILRSKDNKVASLHSSALQWKHKFDLDIICTNGYIALNGLLTSTNSYGEERITYYRRDLNQETGRLGNPAEHTMCFSSDASWDYEISEFYDAVRKGIPVVNGTAQDAVKVMALVEQLYQQSGIKHSEVNV